MDTMPMVISTGNGEKISVQNIDTQTIKKLNENIKGKTYTFGTGRCWGINNKDKKVNLEEIFKVLKI
jgi:hypothetical protein